MTTLVRNKKAFHNYDIDEKFEAGLALAGTEVKSCRLRNASLDEAFGRVRNGEVWLVNAHIATYNQGNRNNHDPRRDRRLLLHKRQIRRLAQGVQAQGFTLVPLSLYLVRGKVKVEIALAKGKRKPDKRETMRRREQESEMRRMAKR